MGSFVLVLAPVPGQVVQMSTHRLVAGLCKLPFLSSLIRHKGEKQIQVSKVSLGCGQLHFYPERKQVLAQLG